VHEWARRVHGDDSYKFVEDQAKQHMAEAGLRWIEAKGFKRHERPPQLPDLKRIEKAWAYLKSVVVHNVDDCGYLCTSASQK
jgi:transposase